MVFVEDEFWMFSDWLLLRWVWVLRVLVLIFLKGMVLGMIFLRNLRWLCEVIVLVIEIDVVRRV